MDRNLAYLEELAKLPLRQRRVLVPLVAWQVVLENPEFPLEPELQKLVARFIEQVGTDPDQLRPRIRSLLDEAGVSMELLRDLQLRSALPPLPKASFTPRAAPAPGQGKGELGIRMMRGGGT